MERDAVLKSLRTHKQQFVDKYAITRLGIFGSVARGQSTDASDVDVIVEMPPDLFQMVHMKEELEELLDASVDLIRRHKYLNIYLQSRIDDEAIYV
jgi:predicted nucleotidyltransferase